MRYPTLPVMQCDPNCGECCGPAMCRPLEFDAIQRFMVDHEITPVAQGLTCPLYQAGKCMIYDVRPGVCRAFGHVEQMNCCKGYNTNVSGKLRRELLHYFDVMKSEGARYLHELLPNGLAYLADEMGVACPK